MSEDRFEEFLKDAAADYNRPPETPREEIWARIQEARQANRDADRLSIRPAGQRRLPGFQPIPAIVLPGLRDGPRREGKGPHECPGLASFEYTIASGASRRL